MKISPIMANGYCRNNQNKINHTPSFKAYIYQPGKGGWSVQDLNPLKQQFDKIIELSLKFATSRNRKFSIALTPIAQEVPIMNRSGKAVSYAWDINAGDKQKYLLFFHGTGQNISNLQALYEAVAAKTDFAILAPEFRGFGKNPPSQISKKTLFDDANNALQYLHSKGIKDEDICVAGHSLGAQVATQLVGKNSKMQRLILLSPINSFISDMDIDKSMGHNISKTVLYLYKKIALLSKDFDDFYGVGKIIKDVKLPVDIIHAKNDNLVKHVSAKKIARKCNNLNSLRILLDGQHKVDSFKIDALVDALNSPIKKINN